MLKSTERIELEDEYAERVAAGEFPAEAEAPTRSYLRAPDGSALEGPSEDDLRPSVVIRTGDERISRSGIEIGTPAIRFLFLPDQPPETRPPASIHNLHG